MVLKILFGIGYSYPKLAAADDGFRRNDCREEFLNLPHSAPFTQFAFQDMKSGCP